MQANQVIAVATNGWVFIGTPTPAATPEGYALEDAAVIRKWGTTQGLGQIALYGAQPETIMDPVGFVEINRANLVYVIAVQVAGGVLIK